jgi:hypothetical protein
MEFSSPWWIAADAEFFEIQEAGRIQYVPSLSEGRQLLAAVDALQEGDCGRSALLPRADLRDTPF